MIAQAEIMECTTEWQLSANTVEKDYVLGWLLAAIGRHPEAGMRWIFKGGTCLKKCYFETYRFSEDLDFSLREDAVYDPGALLEIVRQVCDWAARESGIGFPLERIRVNSKHNRAGQATFEVRVYYRGALPRAADQVVLIKLDLTKHERIVEQAVRRQVCHPYSDTLPQGDGVLAYCLEELTAEKVRALYERVRPRDLYDVVYLLRNRAERLSLDRVREILRLKCEYKGIVLPTIRDIVVSEQVNEMRADWEQMLRHQLPALPDFESVWADLPNLLTWLEKKAAELPVFAPIPLKPGESPIGHHPIRIWRVRVPLEVIRAAGINRLCVKLTYSGETRTVEPYSFRRSKEGNLLFYGWQKGDVHIKALRVDRIEGVKVSNVVFSPRYRVEL